MQKARTNATVSPPAPMRQTTVNIGAGTTTYVNGTQITTTGPNGVSTTVPQTTTTVYHTTPNVVTVPQTTTTVYQTAPNVVYTGGVISAPFLFTGCRYGLGGYGYYGDYYF